jgi:hypothetical protein
VGTGKLILRDDFPVFPISFPALCLRKTGDVARQPIVTPPCPQRTGHPRQRPVQNNALEGSGYGLLLAAAAHPKAFTSERKSEKRARRGAQRTMFVSYERHRLFFPAKNEIMWPIFDPFPRRAKRRRLFFPPSLLSTVEGSDERSVEGSDVEGSDEERRYASSFRLFFPF